MSRILKPGGRAVVMDLLPHDRDDFRRQLGQRNMGFSTDAMQELLAACGFADQNPPIASAARSERSSIISRNRNEGRMIDLNLLVLRCRDIEEAKRFYEHLGLRFSKHAHGGGPEHYAHEDERGVLELYPAKVGGADNVGLGFVATNLEAAHQALTESGYKPREIRETEWGRSFVVRDPDDRRVEIKQ